MNGYLISLYDYMRFRTSFFCPFIALRPSTPKPLREKAYGSAVHDYNSP